MNGLTLADAITPTAAKCVNGIWLPDDFSGRWSAAVREHRLRDLQRQLALTELEMTIFEISSRT